MRRTIRRTAGRAATSARPGSSALAEYAPSVLAVGRSAAARASISRATSTTAADVQTGAPRCTGRPPARLASAAGIARTATRLAARPRTHATRTCRTIRSTAAPARRCVPRTNYACRGCARPARREKPRARARAWTPRATETTAASAAVIVPGAATASRRAWPAHALCSVTPGISTATSCRRMVARWRRAAIGKTVAPVAMYASVTRSAPRALARRARPARACAAPHAYFSRAIRATVELAGVRVRPSPMPAPRAPAAPAPSRAVPATSTAMLTH